MAYDPSIILSGQAPNFLATIAAANEAASRKHEIDRQNAMSAMLQQNGAGIMGGDAAALNSLAAFDPSAALGIKAQQQDMAFSAEKMDMLRKEAKQQAQDRAAAMSAADRQAQASKIEAGLKGAAYFYSKGDKEGYAAFLAQNGIDPAEHPFEMFPAVAAQYEGVLEAYKGFTEMANPAAGKPLTTIGKLKADLGAGYIDQGTYDAAIAKEVARNGINMSVGPDGSVSFSQGDMGSSVGMKPGTVPQGYSAVADPSAPGGYRMVPTPGGPADKENKDASKKLSLAQSSLAAKSKIVDGGIDKAISLIEQNGRMVAGFGATLSHVPESRARDLSNILQTIKANLGFEELQSMRDSSPTGGALGQVTERELAFLQAIQGTIDQAASPESLVQVLKEIKAARQEFARQRAEIMSGAAAPQDSQPQAQPQTNQAQPDDEALIQKYLGNGG